ncbi:MAG: tetratricopeptide repeat protein [Blastocatellia bacterium]|nr:tetratricopeptide repeat protein [Blastocatellia bacterium]
MCFAQDFRQKINTAIENRDYMMAISELKALEKSDKTLFANNNYDYLLARMAEKRGDMATAMAKYQAVVKRNSVVTEYALWHLSQIAHSSGNLNSERNFLRQLLATAPNSLLKNAANGRMARSFFESKDYNAAIQLLQNSIVVQPTSTSPSTSPSNDAKNRENLALLGQAYLQSGKSNEAREVFNKLVNNLPNPSQPDDFALEGAKGLDEMEVGKEIFGKAAPQLNEAEHLRRALIYQFNRSFSLARLHYLAVIERFSSSTFTPEALYQLGRGHILELNYQESVKWFERVQSEFPAHPVAENALSQAASAYSRIR